MNTVERRWGARKSISCKVMLSHSQQRLLHGRITDISISGMFIKTVTTLLTNNNRVNITLAIEDEGVTQILKFQALTIRSTEEGVGLKFENLSIGVVKLLLIFLLKDDDKESIEDHKIVPMQLHKIELWRQIKIEHLLTMRTGSGGW